MGIDADIKALTVGLKNHADDVEKIVAVYKKGFDGKSVDEAVESPYFNQFVAKGQMIESAAKQTAAAKAGLKALRSAMDDAEERFDALTRDLTNTLVYWKSINRNADKIRANQEVLRKQIAKLDSWNSMISMSVNNLNLRGLQEACEGHPKGKQLAERCAAAKKICANIYKVTDNIQSSIKKNSARMEGLFLK